MARNPLPSLRPSGGWLSLPLWSQLRARQDLAQSKATLLKQLKFLKFGLRKLRSRPRLSVEGGQRNKAGREAKCKSASVVKRENIVECRRRYRDRQIAAQASALIG